MARRPFRAESMGDIRSWIIVLAASFGAYVSCGGGLVHWAGQWQLPLLVGCTAGLVSLVPLQGAVGALISTVGGMLFLPQVRPLGVGAVIVEFSLAVVLSLLSGYLLCWLRLRFQGRTKQRVTLGISAFMVAWILVNLWSHLFIAGVPVQGYAELDAGLIRPEPVAGQYIEDHELYRRVFYLMHQGQPYYASFAQAWDESLGAPARPGSPVAIRLPTYFWLWSLLPADAFAIVYMFLGLASLGVVAGAYIAGQLVGARLAPLAAMALAAYAMGVGVTVAVTYVDLPAMAIALVGLALFVRASRTNSTRFLWAAAGVLTLAALTREILVYFIVLAALSSLLEPRGERLTKALPWLTALCLFAAGYSAHAAAVWPLLSPDSATIAYNRGGLVFSASALNEFWWIFKGSAAALCTFFALGTCGALGSKKRTSASFSIYALAALLLPFVAMLWFGNPGINALGRPANYWGPLIVPFALALWPASALLLPTPSKRSASTRH